MSCSVCASIAPHLRGFHYSSNWGAIKLIHRYRNETARGLPQVPYGTMKKVFLSHELARCPLPVDFWK